MNKVNNIKEVEKFLDFLSKKNQRKYSLTKACEELTELQEVLLKMTNKIGPNKPSKQHLVEELGDVYLRLAIINRKFGISTFEINTRIINKANRLIDYYNENEKRKNL